MKIVKSEILSSFQGEDNVRHIIDDKGIECWLTPEVSFNDVANAVGACKFNTIENERKHVLFLFNSDDKEVGRYYLGKKLQGKTPSELVEMKHCLVFFDTWNPKSNKWVPCVGAQTSPHFDTHNTTITINQKQPIPAQDVDTTATSSSYSYTEQMFKQDIADQDERDLLKYGTKDEKIIAQIEKNKRDNRNFWIFIIICFIVIYMFMGLIQKCTKSNYNPLEDDRPWEPRHTQIYKSNLPSIKTGQILWYQVCIS